MPRWTEESRKKQSEMIHNWKPWLKSTGAITEAGKLKCMQNAFKEVKRVEREIRENRKMHKNLKKIFKGMGIFD